MANAKRPAMRKKKGEKTSGANQSGRSHSTGRGLVVGRSLWLTERP